MHLEHRRRARPGRRPSLRLLPLALSLAAAASPASAQVLATEDLDPAVTHVLVPQHRLVPIRPGTGSEVRLEQVDAVVSVSGRLAETTLEMTVRNHGGTLGEAILLVPVPAGATVKGFAYEAAPGLVPPPRPMPAGAGASGAAGEGTIRVMPRDEARRLYDSIVRASRDPGLLEFAGATLLRSSVFPIAPHASQRIRVAWEELLPSLDGRLDYLLPRSESLRASTPWTISVEVSLDVPIAAIYSPSHGLVEVRREAARDPRRGRFTIDPASARAPGPFLMSLVPAASDGAAPAASIAAYPDPTIGGGYFLLLGGLAAEPSKDAVLPREVTIVLDRSGSMTGGKLDQARAAALQVIEGLGEEERFNLIDYSNGVSSLFPAPVAPSAESIARARSYLAALRPSGGTNISDALVEALRQPHEEGTLPIVLFLTDGVPTVGETSERAIREVVERGNPHARRIYAVGVGADVNVPLLDRIADLTRARVTYVVPGEDVEVKVARVFRQLRGPVLADLALSARGADGVESPGRVRDLAPRRIPDLFEGEQVVVLGAYLGEEPATLLLRGRAAGGEVESAAAFDPAHATVRHAYVARLWATRRIAELVDAVRQLAADGPPRPVGAPPVLDDPRARELVEEIVRLSVRFGILTEYTAFFLDEGAIDRGGQDLALRTGEALERRAAGVRTGGEALNQGINWNSMKSQQQLRYDNCFLDASLEERRFANCQQLADGAFYESGGRWIDGSLVAEGGRPGAEADEVVEFGSERHLALAAELAALGRQGALSLPGDVLLRHGDRTILVRNPAEPGA